MKKILLGITVIAAALALASCNKSKQPIVYETPVYQSLATKYTVSTSDQSKANSLEITSSGLYVLVTPDRVMSGKIGKPMISDSSTEIPLLGYGKVQVVSVKAGENVTLKFIPDSGDAIEVSAVAVAQETKPGDDFMFKLNRSWKVVSTVVSVTGGELGEVGVTYNLAGLSLPELKNWAEEKGYKFKLGDVSGYVVEDVTFTPESFIVRFTGAEAVAADLDLGTVSGSSAKFEYEVSAVQKDVPLFNNGKATGTISFDELGALTLELHAKVDVSNDSYNGKAIFKLEKKEI